MKISFRLDAEREGMAMIANCDAWIAVSALGGKRTLALRH